MGSRGGAGQEIARQIANSTRHPGREVNREELVNKAGAQARRSSGSTDRKKPLTNQK